MKIAISGASGFVGGHLAKAFEKKGVQIIKLGRADFQTSCKELAMRLDGCNAIFNLAGESISRRWNQRYMQAIYDSRIETTRQLVKAMGAMSQKPTTFISTSAIGAFKPEGQYTERDIPNANDFLGKLSKAWESEARLAENFGIRTLIFRFALVLGRDGGLMKQVLPPFRLGLGGPIGDGSQYFSWVHINDLVRAYQFAMGHHEMQGVYHICAPHPVTNLVFTKTLGQLLHRPTLLPMPKPLLQLAFGKGAEVMVSGQSVTSERLPEAGFSFEFDTIEKALSELVNQQGEHIGDQDKAA